MNSIHKRLSNQYPWYNNWHKNPDYAVWHWVILISIAITFTILVTNADNSYVYADTIKTTTTLTKTSPPPTTPLPPPPPTSGGSAHMALSLTALSFSGISGGATPAAKTVRLSNSGTAVLNWTASTDQNWCHVSPTSGTLAAVAGKTTYSSILTISVDAPSNIGLFSCFVSISGNADNTPQIIATNYTVTDSSTPPPPPPPPPPPTGGGSGHIVFSATALSFSGISGGITPAAKTDTLSNSATAALSFTASTNQNWCHVSPLSGSLAASSGKTTYSSTLTISVDAPSNIGTFACLVSVSGSADNTPQTIAVTYTVSASGTPPPPPPPPSSGGETGFQVSVGDLSTFIRGNQPNSINGSPLNGFSNLYNNVDAPGFMPFGGDHPAGMDFEHIISGLISPNNSFAPRIGPYPATQLADGTVRLTRQASDDPWKIASTMDYKVVGPHYVDVTYRATYQDPSLFAPYNWTIFFFNQYMQTVPDVAMHFLGVAGPGQTETWQRGDASTNPATGMPDANNAGGTYRQQSAADGQLPYAADNSVEYNIRAYNYPRYTKPFYYGLTSNGMVYELMFDKTITPTDEIRFTIFKFNVKDGGGPAWDYQYIVHNPQVGQTYGYKARVVFKKFVSPEDCLNEYTTWAASLQ